MMDPGFPLPFLQWLRGVDTKEIQFGIVALMIELGADKPSFRKFIGAVGHVLAAEDTEGETLLRRQLRPKISVKVLSCGLGQKIDVIGLHEVVDNNSADDFH